MVVKTFVSELKKKIEMLHSQIAIFEEKVFQVRALEEMINKSTLKEITDINGDDLALISEENYKKITEIITFNDNENNLNNFIMHAVTSKLYAKLLLDGKIDDELISRYNTAKEWLDRQANYLNSLKLSDDLYQKYLGYFENDELIKPLLNISEFNDVLKKSGLITSEKWQILKYIAQKNISLSSNVKKTDLMSDVEKMLREDGNILENLTTEQLDFCVSLIDMSENDLKKLNLTNEDLLKYQKIPILYNIKSLYEKTKDLINANSQDNKKQIEKNKKELLDFKNSYEFFKKIN